MHWELIHTESREGMHWELIHTESREGFDINLYVDQDTEDPSGHFDDGGETVRMIREGRLEWFVAKVAASKQGIELSADYLGGCAYEKAIDFVGPGYYEDMTKAVIAHARKTLLGLGVPPTEIMKEAMNSGRGWTCPDCGRQYEDMTGGPCPSDDCPSHDKIADNRPRATPDQIDEARKMYAEGSDDDIEIDDDALVSEGEGGTWVQAWVWVAAEATETVSDEERSFGPHQAALMRGVA